MRGVRQRRGNVSESRFKEALDKLIDKLSFDPNPVYTISKYWKTERFSKDDLNHVDYKVVVCCPIQQMYNWEINFQVKSSKSALTKHSEISKVPCVVASINSSIEQIIEAIDKIIRITLGV